MEEIFLHKNTIFHVKAIMCSKVMKVLAKSLKNATELRLRRRSAVISLETKSGFGLSKMHM